MGEQVHPIFTDLPVTGQRQTWISAQDTPAVGDAFWEENQAGSRPEMTGGEGNYFRASVRGGDI